MEQDIPIEKPSDESSGNPSDSNNVVKAGNIELYEKTATYDGYILVNDAGDNRVYLMDKDVIIVHEWDLQNGIGNDVELLPNGQLLGIFIAEDPKITFGGLGGKIQNINRERATIWNFDYSSIDYITHHDIELLPNGNIITIVWERKTEEQASLAGSKLEIPIFPEAIIEINPSTNEIVWEWHAWNHLVQDYNSSKENYGNIVESPNLIDLNYVTDKGGDIMHANGLAYDPLNDLIYLSVNFFSEVWVIDHSTSTEVAATHSGGNFGKGGDLIYRFGNPNAYRDNVSERLFTNNHHPNLFEDGKMLIFSNGDELEQSTVYELELPIELTQKSIPNLITPNILWSFPDSELYSPKVSGAVRLPNGNTLITEGDYGIWKVTPEGEVVWKFSGEGFFWRAYHYAKDDPAILALDI
ncbi:aryl-sulfate sulfotransferase [Flagellimonas sp.]|uniref:aryl-sulfate sulfotransferase n=1 Tax=Flagellimonas sp. TaxID=2058762 RepID=UPI003AB18D93